MVMVRSGHSFLTVTRPDFKTLCTTAHGDPDMTQTFVELQKHITETNSHKITLGQGSKYNVPDMISKEWELLVVESNEGNKADD